MGDYSQFRNLYQTGPGEFGPYEISHVADESCPHTKVVMYNDMESDDDHLLRGEVLTLVRITLGQLNLKCFVNAMIAPVCTTHPSALGRRLPIVANIRAVLTIPRFC